MEQPAASIRVEDSGCAELNGRYEPVPEPSPAGGAMFKRQGGQYREAIYRRKDFANGYDQWVLCGADGEPR